ncbi:DUF6119 family protein [Streptomyces olivaceoviridis]|uniref:DUF6119 family protein n=1 Tax=Streptomyces olivaceoviridis TaxID=1921 RepID=UPI0036AB16A1
MPATVVAEHGDPYSRAAAGLLFMRTGRGTCALSYGVGQHMLDPCFRDGEVGLEFATRCLDDDGVMRSCRGCRVSL